VKYLVDPALCSGHGQCYAVAPDVYRGDDEGYNAVQGVSTDVPPDLEESARRGAQVCPESAILIQDAS